MARSSMKPIAVKNLATCRRVGRQHPAEMFLQKLLDTTPPLTNQTAAPRRAVLDHKIGGIRLTPSNTKSFFKKGALEQKCAYAYQR